MKVTVFIDGQMVRLEEKIPLIEAAKMAGISIPTLCYHEALKPYGACRLCMVEVVKGERSRLVTSCNFPTEEGLEVLTDTDHIRQYRRAILELLLAMCPDVPILQEMARQMGVSISRFPLQKRDRCILCGLCVRVCDEIVGARAISLANRGIEREVATPFHDPTQACIGCGSCSYICPTGCIEMVQDGKGIALHMEGHSLNPCTNDYRCGGCEIDEDFTKQLKKAIAAFRKGS